LSPKTSTPEGRGLRLAVALVEGVVIKVKTLPYNSRPRCYFRAGQRRNIAGGMGRISTPKDFASRPFDLGLAARSTVESLKRYIGKHFGSAQLWRDRPRRVLLLANRRVLRVDS